MKKILTLINNTFNPFAISKYRKTDEYKIAQVMKVINHYGVFLSRMGREFHIKPEQSRCSIRYKSGENLIIGTIELDVRNEYQFEYVKNSFDKQLKHKLNRNRVSVDFLLNRMYN